MDYNIARFNKYANLDNLLFNFFLPKMKKNKELHQILKSFTKHSDQKVRIAYPESSIIEKFPNIENIHEYLIELVDKGYLEVVDDLEKDRPFKPKNYCISNSGRSAVFNETLLEELKKHRSEKRAKNTQLFVWIMGSILTLLTIGGIVWNWICKTG